MVERLNKAEINIGDQVKDFIFNGGDNIPEFGEENLETVREIYVDIYRNLKENGRSRVRERLEIIGSRVERMIVLNELDEDPEIHLLRLEDEQRNLDRAFIRRIKYPSRRGHKNPFKP